MKLSALLLVLPLVSAQCGTDTTYDYVVVGGGTAGSVVGTRLAESGYSVAIIEAGGIYETDLPALEIPVNFGVTGGTSPDVINKDVDWGFITEAQTGVNDRQVHYARGKGVGGSSAVNGLIYQRGTKASYEQWAKSVNDTSYEWDSILPYFEKSVRFTPPDTSKRFENATTSYNPDVFANSSSPSVVDVSYLNYVSPFSTWLKNGFEEAGISEVEDFNSGDLIGAQYCSSSLSPESQLRSSADYIAGNAVGKTKLTVCTKTLAQQILFDGDQNAIGVVAELDGKGFTLTARKEVVLSAGAFNSPQLLMVSGIGPKPTLESLNIPVLVEAPGVGQNMWDHVWFGISHPVNADTLTRYFNDVQYANTQTLEFLATKSGVLASGLDLLGWEKLPDSLRENFTQATKDELDSFPPDWPEVEYISGNLFNSNYSNSAAQQPKDGQQYATIIGALAAPTSRGNVSITSASTMDLPAINPNWLSTETDVQVSIALFKRIREIWQTGPLQDIATGPEAYPGEEVASDEQILDAIKNSLTTVWHASGTCKMGTQDDPAAVVDTQGKVYGVKKLRVVDASVFALLPPGHPTSTVYMLAEKIADDIIKDN